MFEVWGEGKHVSDEGGGCGGCGWRGRRKMCLLWAVGAVRAGGAGGHAGAAIEHYLSLGEEEGMWVEGAVGVVGTLLWAVSAVKAQNQTKQEGAPPNADPAGVGGLLGVPVWSSQ